MHIFDDGVRVHQIMPADGWLVVRVLHNAPWYWTDPLVCFATLSTPSKDADHPEREFSVEPMGFMDGWIDCVDSDDSFIEVWKGDQAGDEELERWSRQGKAMAETFARKHPQVVAGLARRAAEAAEKP